MKKFIHDYLTFNKKERIGIIFFAVVFSVILFLPEIIPGAKVDKTPQDTSWISMVRKLEQNESSQPTKDHTWQEDNNSHQYERSTNSYFNKQKSELFYFDPNTLNVEGWKKLGLRERTIQTIRNYLNKGGHFKSPEDLQKVYGLHKDDYERLVPYVKIEPSFPGNYEKQDEKRIESRNTVGSTFRSYKNIEVNSADTTAFISLPGIGSKLASRIINFRDKLGGFYAVEQVGETYGLPDSTFQKIKPFLKVDNASTRKFDINTATKDELKMHPYIKWNLANAIVVYREQHGLFSKVEDIKKITIITEEIYNKLVPYLFVK